MFLQTKDNLVKSLIEGSLDLVGSDHCTYDSSTRAQGQNNFTAIPQGVNGVEERMSVVYERGVVEGKMSMTRYVEVTSSKAAKLLNIYPRKGCIVVGSDADIVIWDPAANNNLNKEEQISKWDFNIFDGMAVVGAPEYVIFKGKVIKIKMSSSQ